MASCGDAMQRSRGSEVGSPMPQHRERASRERAREAQRERQQTRTETEVGAHRQPAHTLFFVSACVL